jgi:hypothetical protein
VAVGVDDGLDRSAKVGRVAVGTGVGLRSCRGIAVGVLVGATLAAEADEPASGRPDDTARGVAVGDGGVARGVAVAVGLAVGVTARPLVGAGVAVPPTGVGVLPGEATVAVGFAVCVGCAVAMACVGRGVAVARAGTLVAVGDGVRVGCGAARATSGLSRNVQVSRRTVAATCATFRADRM